jgi:hypothetical protein
MQAALTQNSLQTMIADFSSDAEITKELIASRRERIIELELAMQQLPNAENMEQFNQDGTPQSRVTHHFGTGVYARELFIPAGNLIVSKIHRGKTFSCIAKGVISVICPHSGYNTYTGPHCFVSEPFTKRIVIAHEDTLWITSHGTDKTDLDEVEAEIIAIDFGDAILEEAKRE